MELGVREVRIRDATLLCAAIAFALLLLAAPAHAAFPGTNGKIAFASNRDGNYEIYTINPDGSGVTRLTNDPGFDLNPAWSSDGKKIAFESNHGGSYGDIYVMNADGSGRTRLTATYFGQRVEPAWSPDGTEIALSYNGTIEAIASDGTGERLLRSGFCDDASFTCTGFREPAWSPDGTTLAVVGEESNSFSGNPEQDDIWTISTNSSSQANITNTRSPAVSETFPDWSPDGARIVVQVDPPFASSEIWTMNQDGLDRARLTTNPASDQAPAWSPDRSKVAFSSDRNGDIDVYVMSSSGGGETDISNSPDTVDLEPDWQPLPGPQRSDYKNAAQFCKAERDFMGSAAFTQKYGGGANAHGKCVSQSH